jgi:hypothetical protein
MHIFAADEHPSAVLVYTSRRALLIPRSAGFHDIADGGENGGEGERAQMAAVLPFLEAASRGQLTNSAATISDGGASFLTGLAVDRAAKLRHTLRGERPCDHVSPF